MYTSQKREHVNAFASRLLGVDSETLLRDQECIVSGTGRIAFRTTRRVEVAPGSAAGALPRGDHFVRVAELVWLQEGPPPHPLPPQEGRERDATKSRFY